MCELHSIIDKWQKVCYILSMAKKKKNDTQETVVAPVEEHVLVTETIDNPSLSTRTSISLDLNISQQQVDVYFEYYSLNKRFPIRNLSMKEKLFAQYIYDLQVADNKTILEMRSRYDVSPEEYKNDAMSLPMKMAGLEKNQDYEKLIKWNVYLLEPFILYGNSQAPELKPLSKMELFLVISNIAMGKSIIPGQNVEIKDQLVAIQKLIDAYELIPADKEKVIEEDDFAEMSIAELKAGIKLLTNRELQESANLKKNTSKVPVPRKTTKTKVKKNETKQDNKSQVK